MTNPMLSSDLDSSLQDLRYGYNKAGNVLIITDTLAGQVQSFVYDDVDRMTGVSGAYSASYGYNAIGNITWWDDGTGVNYFYESNKPHAVTDVGVPPSYFKGRYSYDANGNMITRTVGSTTYGLSYDAENRLTQVVSGTLTTSFGYDADGKRVKATVGTTTTVYIGDYYEQTGSTVKKYYYAGGQRVAMRENSSLYWLLTDHLGSTAITANQSGGKHGELRYKAFGETRYSTGTTPTQRQFTGQILDSTTSLYYYGARYYDHSLGRFIQADAIVPDAPDTPLSALTVNFSNPAFLEEIGRENRWRARQGIPQQQWPLPEGKKPRGLGVVQWFQEPPGWPRFNQTGAFPSSTLPSNPQARGPVDPQNLNRYTYVRNNPLRYVDPNGYWTFGIGFGFTAGLGSGFSFSVLFIFDDKGNIGVIASGGGGGYAGVGGSAGAVLQGTTAEVIPHLTGPVVQTGGSVDIGYSVGGEWVVQNGPTGPIQGINVNIGAGLTLGFPVPVPFEMHSMLEYGQVLGWINLPSLIGIE
jgi:RHS repeat-associated protein